MAGREVTESSSVEGIVARSLDPVLVGVGALEKDVRDLASEVRWPEKLYRVKHLMDLGGRDSTPVA